MTIPGSVAQLNGELWLGVHKKVIHGSTCLCFLSYLDKTFSFGITYTPHTRKLSLVMFQCRKEEGLVSDRCVHSV